MKKLLVGLAAILVSTGVMAETKPFNLSLTPNIAIYDRSETIHGLTLSIWGENQQTSLALGIANGSTGQSAGLSAGILNYADNLNYAGRLTGLHLGLINYAEDADSGVQIGLINVISRNTNWFTDLPNALAPVMILVNWRF